MYDHNDVNGKTIGGESLVSHAAGVWGEIVERPYFFVKQEIEDAGSFHPVSFLLEPGPPDEQAIALFRIFTTAARVQEYLKYLDAVSTGKYAIYEDSLEGILTNTWEIFREVLAESDGPGTEIPRRIIVVSHSYKGMPYSIESIYDSGASYH